MRVKIFQGRRGNLKNNGEKNGKIATKLVNILDGGWIISKVILNFFWDDKFFGGEIEIFEG